MIIQYAKEPFKITEKEYWVSEKRETIYWLDDYGAKAHLKMWVRDERDLNASESIEFLWEVKDQPKVMNPIIRDHIASGRVFRINTAHKDFEKWLEETTKKITAEEYFVAGEYISNQKRIKKRLNILGLGDVGSTMALALCLYGKDIVKEIGIFDLDENRVSRWEQELNQIAEPLTDHLPKVKPVKLENIFDCDLFAFTASVGVPPISITEGDVRVVQFQGNAKLIGYYAKLAVDAGFKGIFAVVSDPVDQLCRHAFETSNRDELGNWHGNGLAPEQIRGYGLGVMNGRAAYYAQKDERIFAPEGRVYGPHGKGLVIANSWRIGQYDEVISEKWTNLTITANLQMRAIGHKPYIAPAVASGAISITKTLLGEKHYSCISFDGFYYGCLNQYIAGMDIFERLESDPELIRKIKKSAEELDVQWQNL